MGWVVGGGNNNNIKKKKQESPGISSLTFDLFDKENEYEYNFI